MLTFLTNRRASGKWRAHPVRWTLATAAAIAAMLALLVPPLIVTTVTAPEASVLVPADRDTGGAVEVGVFTGEYANGVPVYRLPPISVVGERQRRSASERATRSAGPKGASARDRAAADTPA
jgi:hypothetical protein